MRRLLSAAALATAVVFTACSSDSTSDVGSDKLASLREGMPRDSVFSVIGTGPLTAQYTDTLRLEKGFRRNTYLIDGKFYDVVFYRELQGNVAEPVQQAKETPIVIQNGKVLGWGWAYYADAMKTLKLPSPLAMVPSNASAPAVPEVKPDSALPDSLNKPQA